MIHNDNSQLKIMIVGGPNQRTDYHINEGDEWFLMIEGDMNLKVVDYQRENENNPNSPLKPIFKDTFIKEGECYLLPSLVPHSPQRAAKTVGLVIERERFINELDGLRWYCMNPECRHELITFAFRCEDLGSQLKVIIGDWYQNTEEAIKRRTCPKCGTVETRPIVKDTL
jgi:3-hydroxyanthranilate 3,4-dioxygenase